ncbi:MAG: type II toxin-antitoxin system Phd/YefM family antitoxin [Rhodospirillales bacterium]|nr:type II toxin-antitoxin system Phd/YefM family antitoxin [Rhodospirillales bacterium]
MRKVVNLSEAKNQLSSLVDRVASGEEIVIATHGQPMARLVAVPRPKTRPRQPMNLLGLTYMSDGFDAPWALVPAEQTGHGKKGKRR